MVALISITLFFFFCEFGGRVDHQFDAINVEFYQYNWYLFPIELQQMLVVFMSGIQQPMIIRGYANTELTREAFKKV